MYWLSSCEHGCLNFDLCGVTGYASLKRFIHLRVDDQLQQNHVGSGGNS